MSKSVINIVFKVSGVPIKQLREFCKKNGFNFIEPTPRAKTDNNFQQATE